MTVFLSRLSRNAALAAVASVLLLINAATSHASTGLSTRSQNPLLQGYLIPNEPLAISPGWSFAHSLHITNTYQTDSEGSENLVIDVENTRYDLQISYGFERWALGITLSAITNRGGQLDNLIEDWHDFFGLPQAGRDLVTNDQIELLYQDNGVDVVNISSENEGIGDLQLSLSYQLGERNRLWLILDIPSGDDNLLSNQGTDIAFAYNTQHDLNSRLKGFGTIGVSLLSDSGLLGNRIEDAIVFGHYGLLYGLNDHAHLIFQADWHSAAVKQTRVNGLDHSLQGQFGLRLPRLIEDYQLDIFFSEDIWPEHAPDITFSLRLSPVWH